MLRSFTAVTSPYFLVMWSSVTPAMDQVLLSSQLGAVQRCPVSRPKSGPSARSILPARDARQFGGGPRAKVGADHAASRRPRRARSRLERGVLRAATGADRRQLSLADAPNEAQVTLDHRPPQMSSRGK